MNKITKEPKYKLEKKDVQTITDKNGTILLVGNKLKDEKGKVHKIENIQGVAMVVYPVVGKRRKTTLLRKYDFTKCEKVA